MIQRVPFLALVLAIQAGGCSFYPERATITEEKTLDLSGIHRVEVETRNGRVDVRSLAAATSYRLKYTKSARGMTEEDARQAAESITVEAARDANQPNLFRLIARIPTELSQRSPGVEFDLEVPADADVDVRTSNGAINVEGARSILSLKSSNGRIGVKDIHGNVTARTSNGVIAASRVRGDLVLESSNGAIELEEVEAKTINASTSNGRIQAEKIAGQTTFHTSNGSITLKATSLTANPLLKATTSNGSVRVEVPATVNAKLSLKTSNGSIEKRLEHATVTNLEASRRAVSAVLNGGGGDIEVVTSNGGIRFETVP